MRALPAADGGPDFLGRDGMGELVFERPAADLGAVEFEGVQAERLGSRKAVRTGRRAGRAFLEQVQDGLWPSGGQRVKAAGREAELLGGLAGTGRVLPEGVEDVADK